MDIIKAKFYGKILVQLWNLENKLTNINDMLSSLKL